MKSKKIAEWTGWVDGDRVVGELPDILIEWRGYHGDVILF
jgi:hypothetical protein